VRCGAGKKGLQKGGKSVNGEQGGLLKIRRGEGKTPGTLGQTDRVVQTGVTPHPNGGECTSQKGMGGWGKTWHFIAKYAAGGKSKTVWETAGNREAGTERHARGG